MTIWFIIAGAIALFMALTGELVRRGPLTTALAYLGIGYVLGPKVFGLVDVRPAIHALTIRAITEVVIVISIFSSALKMRIPALDTRWFEPLRLVFLSMPIGIGALWAAAHFLLGWPALDSLLLAAVLAPTDPVLASDVQVEKSFQFHNLRFALTGEAGMNDGSALPVIKLALLLMGLGDTQSVSNWILVDVVWGFLGGVAIGWASGYVATRLLLHLWLKKRYTFGTPFFAIGLIGLSYGLAQAAHAIGFVAVFAAGVAARAIEPHLSGNAPHSIQVKVRDPAAEMQIEEPDQDIRIFMLIRMLFFTETLERLGSAVVVIMLGSFIRGPMFSGPALFTALLLFFLVRPVSVLLGLPGSRLNWLERSMAAWFGVRGMASVYYLAYIYAAGISAKVVDEVGRVAIGVVIYSILFHGISATPLMNWFERKNEASGA